MKEEEEETKENLVVGSENFFYKYVSFCWISQNDFIIQTYHLNLNYKFKL